MTIKINIQPLDELRELVAISGDVDGVGFEWGFNAIGETPLERRRELLAELLENLPLGVVDSAPILTDIRTRDGFLRTYYELVEAEELLKVADIVKGLLEFAQGSKGEVRGMALICWAGCLWMLGNVDGITAISEGEPLTAVKDISLWQLLDIAIRHSVPSRIWSASLQAVSLDACLKGAV